MGKVKKPLLSRFGLSLFWQNIFIDKNFFFFFFLILYIENFFFFFFRNINFKIFFFFRFLLDKFIYFKHIKFFYKFKNDLFLVSSVNCLVKNKWLVFLVNCYLSKFFYFLRLDTFFYISLKYKMFLKFKI